MDALGPAALAWCALSLACAGVVKGAAGIGIPLVGLSMLSLVLPLPQAVALLPIPVIVANTWQALAGGLIVETFRRFPALLAAMAAGTFLGAAMLARVDHQLLLLVVGCVVLAFALLELTRLRIRVPARHQTFTGAACGLAGGFVGGMSAIFGPPIIVFLMSTGMAKEAFVGTITTIYLVSGILLAVALAGHGVAGGDELLWSALATGPLFAGVLAGQWLRRRVSEEIFRRGLMALLALIALNMIRRGLA